MDPIAVDLPAAAKPAAPKPDARPDAAQPFGLLGALTSFSRKQAIGACVAGLSLCAGVAVVKYSTPAPAEKATEKLTPAETAKTVCKKIYECCNQGEVAGNSLYGPDESGCQTKVTQALDQTAQVKAGVSKGRLVYNSDRVMECLTQYKSQTCEQLKSTATTSTPACDAYLDPKVPVGGACGFDKECIGGSCVGEGIGTDGVCAAYVAENAGCNDGGTCGV